jgi:two-component system sensor histidine kinase VanS
MKRLGIFIKVFMYTLLFLVLVLVVTTALFTQQSVSFYHQTEQLYDGYQDLVNRLDGKSPDEVKESAQYFYERNLPFQFIIRYKNGNTLYSTPSYDTDAFPKSRYKWIAHIGNDYVIQAVNTSAGINGYINLIYKIIFALAGLLCLSVLGAFVFARQMTNPIKQLASDTKKMSRLEPVDDVSPRNDELGDLTRDVHAMYEKLKVTITDLEKEKDAQRYFFAAASHEMRTPIAAVNALLQGMFDNIGEYKDHSKYLWECLKLVKEQNKIIDEILEIIQLDDAQIILQIEKINLNRAITSLLPVYEALIEANELTVTLQIPDELYCAADLSLLNKALSNVLINAVQNTPKQGEVRIWSEAGVGVVRLNILNTGAQIDNDLLPKLFSPFYRIDESRGKNGGHSGLGLTIAAKALGLMKVDFALENTREGVKFWVDLPTH